MENTQPIQVNNQPNSSQLLEMYKYLMPLLIVIIFFLAIGFGFVLLKKTESNSALSQQNLIGASATNGSITGTLDINGAIPQGATLNLTARDVSGRSQPTVFETNIQLHDNTNWSYDTATSNSSYEIQANVVQDGKVIAQSSPVSVTAPATDVALTLNIQSANPSVSAIISGDIVVNGYVPPGSKILIKGRVAGSQNFTTVASNLVGAARQIMTYSTAKSGVSYEVEGSLLSSDGDVIGTSSLLTVTAPAAHEVLNINSSAQVPAAPTPTVVPAPSPDLPQATVKPSPTPPPPLPPAVISGTLNVNGIAPANSRIVILAKVYNSSDYMVVVDNVQPLNGTSWKWKNPAQSTWYDVIAVMKQKQSDGSDKDISTSSKVSVAAPATSINLTINTGFSLNAPNGQISVDCGNQSGTNWNAKVTFGAESNAGSYWFQIGSSNGGHELTDATTNANGSNPLVLNFQLNNGSTYYARYAYSTQPNLNTGNAQYSAFSKTQEIKCGG